MIIRAGCRLALPARIILIGMKSLYKISLCFLCMTVLASCRQEAEYAEKDGGLKGEYEVIIAASQASDPTDPETRTEVQNWSKVFWLPGDKISVFSAGKMGEFTSQNTESTSSTFFKGRIVVNTYDLIYNGGWINALYPYDPDATIDGNVITTTLPSVQQAVAGGVADDLLATASRSKDPFIIDGNLEISLASTGVGTTFLLVDEDGGLTAKEMDGLPGLADLTGPAPEVAVKMRFEHLCSGLRFCLTQKGIDKITLSSNGGEPLAGTFSFSWVDNVPVLQTVSNPSSSITLTAPDGGTFQKGVWYCFVTLPVQLNSGLTFTLESGNKIGKRVYNSRINLNRAVFSRASDMDKDVALAEPIPELLDVSSNLPVLYVNTPNGAPIVSKTEWLKKSHAYLKDTDGKVTDLGEAQIRGRGNSTWGYRKKPYALKLDKKAGLLGMPKDKRWDLLANYLDRTRLRNDIALEMGRRLSGLAWTPKGRYVELVLNGVHHGNYYLVEHIKVSTDRVNITEMKSADVAEPEITGGYLMELSIEYDEVNKFLSNNFTDLYYPRTWGITHTGTGSTFLPFMIKDPDEDTMVPAQLDWISQYINDLQLLITSTTTANNYGAYWRPLVDMDSFIDWMFVNEIVGNGEPLHPKSCYMHKNREGKLVMGPLWDFDYNTFNDRIEMGTIFNYSIWYGYMMRDKTFKSAAKARWPAAKAAFLNVANNYIPTMAASIRASVAKDVQIWGAAGNTVNGDESYGFTDAYTALANSIRTRVSRLDSIVNTW